MKVLHCIRCRFLLQKNQRPNSSEISIKIRYEALQSPTNTQDQLNTRWNFNFSINFLTSNFSSIFLRVTLQYIDYWLPLFHFHSHTCLYHCSSRPPNTDHSMTITLNKFSQPKTHNDYPKFIEPSKSQWQTEWESEKPSPRP